MKLRVLLAATVILGLLTARDAAAQKLSLQIDKGLVTLDAESVTVDEILARWTATTGLNVISKNGRGSDVPVTLRLEAVPERDALTMILRDLSGYIMGERRDPQSGVVSIDRLMILPDSAAQAPASMPAAAGRQPAVVRRATPPPAFVLDQPADIGVASDAVIEPQIEGGVPIESAPAQAAPARPRRPGEIVPADEAPSMPLSKTPIAGQDGKDVNPFGSSSSFSRPGMIAPVPPPPTVQIGSPSEDPAFRPPPPQP